MEGPIGIFDSGIGGLTVVQSFIEELPNEEIIYFGDTARVPYGSKSPSTVIKFAQEDAQFLLKFSPKIIVVACHTASSLALSALSHSLPIPVLGMVKPAVKASIKRTKNNRIGVIGTRATIKSRAYQKQILKEESNVSVFGQACPLFVPLVEEGWIKGKVIKEVVTHYLSNLKKKNIDTLILACTHYPLISGLIKEEMGKGVSLVNPARELVKEVKKLLTKKNLLAKKRRRKDRFFLSDLNPNFKKLGECFLGMKIEKIKEVTLDI